MPERLWRLSCWCHRHDIPVLPKMLKAVVYVLFHAVLPFQCELGDNVKLMHGALGVVIHPNTTIGDNVTFYPHAVVATDVPLASCSRARIGNDVKIYTGAIVVGPLYLHDRCVIGAGAVVTRDVPAGHVAVGVPARTSARVSCASIA
jgi:serine O-acetyltransferase